MKFWKLALAATSFILSSSVNAALVERLGGLAYYDDVANLTWLADANAAGVAMNWADANAWAVGLTVDGVDGWRLPDSDTCSGYNCTSSEMGNLFYNVLGGSAGTPLTTTHNTNYDLFSNIQSAFYWSATENLTYTDSAWFLDMYFGNQNFATKITSVYAWAVQTGDISSVPIPASIWLFGSGLIGLIGFARRN